MFRSFWLVCLCAFALIPFLGQDFFPDTDSGQFILHVRAKTGTRIEETARLADQVETQHPADDSRRLKWTIFSTTSACRSAASTTSTTTRGSPARPMRMCWSRSKQKHHPTADYVRTLREQTAARISRRHVLFSSR